MKNEPVAWMQTWQNQDGELKRTVNIEQIGKHDIPLYTHPAELTDEEIYKVWFNYGCGMPWTANTKTFARAILKRAQEK